MLVHPIRRSALPYSTLLRMPQTWGVILSKTLTDPVGFFVTDGSRSFSWQKATRRKTTCSPSGFPSWPPTLATLPVAAFPAFSFGGLDGRPLAEGRLHGRSARDGDHCNPVVFDGFAVLVGSLAISTLAYAAFSTIIRTLPADIYPTGSVASVSGYERYWGGNRDYCRDVSYWRGIGPLFVSLASGRRQYRTAAGRG